MRKNEQGPEPSSEGKHLPRRQYTGKKASGDANNSLLDLQRTIGNQSVLSLLQSGSIQAKLRVSQPGDADELEADRAAEQVASSPQGHSKLRRKCSCARGSSCPECQEVTKNLVQGKHSLSSSLGGNAPDNPLRNLGAGQAMEPALLQTMGSRFGNDFSNVRIHTGSSAAESAQALNAKAFTLGRDIVFNSGEYAPHTQGGKKLLAHELAHVVQQSGGIPQKIQRQQPPAPSFSPPVKKKFQDLPDGQPVPDPLGRTHGITVERRGDELFYHVPQLGTRRVPRPLDTDQKPPKPMKIDSVKWGSSIPFQAAFEVDFDGILSPPFMVNIFGEGRLQTLVGALLRQPPALEVHGPGLELEREPDILGPRRPSAKRFQDAKRYHHPSASFSLYVFPDRHAEVIEDSSGTTKGGPWTRVVDLQVSPAGEVNLTWNDPVGTVTVRFSLQGPNYSPTGLGALPKSQTRTSLLSALHSLGVGVVERGRQFTDVELQTAVDILARWKGTTGVVPSLKKAGAPGLKLVKDILNSEGSYSTDTGEVKIAGAVEMSESEQRNMVNHELTHALFLASGLMLPKKGTAPTHVTQEATHLAALSSAGAIQEGVLQGSSHFNKPRTQAEWEKALSTSATLNKIWEVLHLRFSIGDPERTGDIRGMDVADESRYQGGPRGDVVGHGFDNVNEFMASFVTSTLRLQAQMSATVLASGDQSLARTYKQLWDFVNTNMLSLGAQNPYDSVLLQMQKRTKKP